MNIKTHLTEIAVQNGLVVKSMQFPDCDIDPAKIKVIMISEVPPKNPDDGFFSAAPEPDYMKSTLGLFNAAGVQVNNMRDILNMGIYVTTAVKSPKTEYTVDPGVIKAHLPLLKAELSLFPNLKIIMLMGDVAKKAVNMIAKAGTKKNVIPSGATGRLRHNEYYWSGIRVFPSYIMTGKNLLIEPFKRDCVAEDIRRMIRMSNEIYSRCGIPCNLCLIYRPNVEKEDRRAEVCATWNKLGARKYDPATVICDGCHAEGYGKVCFSAGQCAEAPCVIKKGIPHCGYCDDYPCAFFAASPDAPGTDEFYKDMERRGENWTAADDKIMEPYHPKKFMDEWRKKQ